MIVVRDVFRVRFGQMKDALASMQQLPALLQNSGEKFSVRILTDVSGPFYTLVLESTFEDLGTYQSSMKALAATEEWKSWYQGFFPLVTDGQRELYTLVSSS